MFVVFLSKKNGKIAALVRDSINENVRSFVASYEPLVSDVSVSVKFLDQEPLPNAGAVYSEGQAIGALISSSLERPDGWLAIGDYRGITSARAACSPKH